MHPSLCDQGFHYTAKKMDHSAVSDILGIYYISLTLAWSNVSIILYDDTCFVTCIMKIWENTYWLVHRNYLVLIFFLPYLRIWKRHIWGFHWKFIKLLNRSKYWETELKMEKLQVLLTLLFAFLFPPINYIIILNTNVR